MLELFQTTQPQLSQWLQEKELMMSVLGPLSVDPNMLNTQKQQVQVLAVTRYYSKRSKHSIVSFDVIFFTFYNKIMTEL